MGEGDTATHRRGVKLGMKRGKYNRPGDKKKRVLAVAEDGSGDWRAVAIASGVKLGTAYGWLKRSEQSKKHCGGQRHIKLTEESVDVLLGFLEEDPQLTLKDLATKLLERTGVSVTTTTIHRRLEGRLITRKKVRSEPSAMNSLVGRQKRAAYVTAVMDAAGGGKKLIYVDKCNCNLFLRRSNGRSGLVRFYHNIAYYEA